MSTLSGAKYICLLLFVLNKYNTNCFLQGSNPDLKLYYIYQVSYNICSRKCEYSHVFLNIPTFANPDNQ